MTKSRTENSVINSLTSVIVQVLTVIINFIVKTVFIKTLGQEYLGANGLFSNIITMLSLADLGLGVAIPYSLYKPLAEGDRKKIKVLMNFYKKIYNIIGIGVLIIGFSLIPFLDFFITEKTSILNLSFIYALFVIHSASSYFFIYKKMLIDSDQKSYITSRIVFTFSTVLSIVQILVLLILKNYILYLISSIIFVILQNIYISIKANKMYPYITEKNDERIEKEDVAEITKNVGSLFIYKVGNVIMNGTDNLVISRYISLVMVGLYSNYILITNSLNLVVNQLFNAITSSIGNLVVTNDERSEYVYNKLNFANFWIYSVCSICLLVLVNPFVNLWLGKDYLLSYGVILLLIINFYIVGLQSVTNSFRNAYGLFHIARYRPILMVIINIIVSIILVRFIGVAGVLIGTLVSRLFTTAWLDPYIVYKHGFKKKPTRYYLKYIIYFFLFLSIGFSLSYLINLIQINSIILWIIISIFVFVLVNSILFFIFRNTGDFRYFYEKGKVFIKHKIRHN